MAGSAGKAKSKFTQPGRASCAVLAAQRELKNLSCQTRDNDHVLSYSAGRRCRKQPPKRPFSVTIFLDSTGLVKKTDL
jgi:hypothetical protein